LYILYGPGSFWCTDRCPRREALVDDQDVLVGIVHPDELGKLVLLVAVVVVPALE
jgi:hypothetical protein